MASWPLRSWFRWRSRSGFGSCRDGRSAAAFERAIGPEAARPCNGGRGFFRYEGREYLSVKLDDPSFPSPIYASLVEVEGEDGLSLIWSRRTAD